MEEHYRGIADSIIQRSTPEIDLEEQTKIDNFERGMDAFSLYNSVYLEIIAYEEDASQQEQAAVLLGAFNHHHLESQKILINSVYQSFCGNYNIAYSLLRSFIECHMRGIFLNQLALSQHDSGLWKVTLSSSVQESYGELVNQLKNYRANRDKILDNAQFLDMVSDLNHELGFSELLKQLISWEFTSPEKNYHNFRNYSRYGKLSGYAHSEEKTQDISRLKRYFGNDEQKAMMGTSMIIPQLSKEYLSDMCCVIDASMVVMLNFISRVLTFDFYSGFEEFITNLKGDQRFSSARLNYCTKWLSAYLESD
tara:strand:- start:203 stop:1129 length:927 start_codon:yes stop_codon:yes gene_type:complete